MIRRLSNWLDDKGWLSTWEHVWFDFENYKPLRRQGMTHKQAVATLDADWRRRKERRGR